jgi:Protein of unknown function with PCYCGC motif
MLPLLNPKTWRVDMKKSKIALAILATFAAFIGAFVSSGQTSTAADVPAFHDAPPAQGVTLPPLLGPSQLTEAKNLTPEYQRIVGAAYRAAEAVSDDLYQEPCYCHCDRMVGHKSLRSCYESEHAVHCDTCLKELFYVYAMKKQSKSAAEIRNGIMAGDWQKIDLPEAASHADKGLANGSSLQ